MQTTPASALRTLVVQPLSLGQRHRARLDDGAQTGPIDVDLLDARQVRLHEVDTGKVAARESGLQLVDARLEQVWVSGAVVPLEVVAVRVEDRTRIVGGVEGDLAVIIGGQAGSCSAGTLQIRQHHRKQHDEQA